MIREEDLFARQEAERRAAQRETAMRRYGVDLGLAYDALTHMTGSMPQERRDEMVDEFADLVIDRINSGDRVIARRAIRALVDLAQNVPPHHHEAPRYR